MNKKILAIIAILITIVIIFGFLVVAKRKSMNNNVGKNKENGEINNKESNEIDDNVKENEKNDFSENPDENIQNKKSKDKNYKLSNLLIFDKEDGNISLYNQNGNLIDKISLKKMFGDEYVLISNGINDKGIEDEKGLIYVKINDTDLINPELEDSFMWLYDKNGEKISKVDLSGLINVKKENEEIEEDKGTEKDKKKNVIQIGTKLNKEKTSQNKDKTLNYTVDTTFETFKTIDNYLIFKDVKRNLLILVNAEDDEIVSNVLLKGLDLTNLTSVFFTNKDIYLTYSDSTEILEIPRKLANSGDIDTEDIIIYDVENIPNFVYVEDEIIYFTADNILGKYDTALDTGDLIDIGAKALDLYFTDDYIYLISEFGKSNENSVLIKIDKNKLSTQGIMELKGIYSKFIGTQRDIAYIRQKDSIKEVDLKNFKPINSYKRTSGIPIQTNGNVFYRLEDNKIQIFNIKSQSDILNEFEVEGYNFHFVNINN